MADRQPSIGEITWTDLTVADAPGVRDFYQAVVGWTATPVDMGGYDDFCLEAPGSGRTVAGICHARGANAGLPAQWLLYFNVADLEASLATCLKRGGKAFTDIRTMPGVGRFCVIQDPAGAVAALFQTT
jgi:predicted enzyme related to lactoylglutathione lyase